MIMYVKNTAKTNDAKAWEKLFSLYPGLEQPIRETYNDPSSARRIYMLTPTKTRSEQKPDLTRLAQTLYLIPNLLWIIIEDEVKPTLRVRKILESFNIPCVHLNYPTPSYLKITANQSYWRKPRGMLQKNIGLDWLRNNTQPTEDALVYFADDDNTYHWRIFREIRKVQNVGVWPVGIVGELLYEGPVCTKGKVHSWFCYVFRNRQFPIDMAGFAIHLRLIHSHKDYYFNVSADSIGQQESHILSTMTTIDELECLANDASKIYVWHTRTIPTYLTSEDRLKRARLSYDLLEEVV
ncbi:unnamed protein product [Didymodactylos carnosus]|uniref:Galactosylgalactosylxylosylprotein 3-beta-glucuronosyltransferase n=1 Tax=Didymodactylos carnosus TaxID=1234261 RepID=A0A813VZD2_9BILA|nr:unnamed protein product [Didymodactylos carnosus]CAF0906690.1 unnamed protein product [Didymodactylos carnosus]CAF3632334.1 unnamed protein product [Didymodactylos carnosus]CAF3686470.1 unnamed protein product [Didymodactylos carnosus]